MTKLELVDKYVDKFADLNHLDDSVNLMRIIDTRILLLKFAVELMELTSISPSLNNAVQEHCKKPFDEIREAIKRGDK